MCIQRSVRGATAPKVAARQLSELKFPWQKPTRSQPATMRPSRSGNSSNISTAFSFKDSSPKSRSENVSKHVLE